MITVNAPDASRGANADLTRTMVVDRTQEVDRGKRAQSVARTSSQSVFEKLKDNIFGLHNVTSRLW